VGSPTVCATGQKLNAAERRTRMCREPGAPADRAGVRVHLQGLLTNIKEACPGPTTKDFQEGQETLFRCESANPKIASSRWRF